MNPLEKMTWINDFIANIQRVQPAWDYGYVEILDDTEVPVGHAYSDLSGNWMPWDRAFKYRIWQKERNNLQDYKWLRKIYPVKGIHWGNIFGPDLLNKMGGRDNVKRSFEGLYSPPLCKHRGFMREYENGSCGFFLSADIHVSKRPEVSRPASPFTEALWLWKILRERNLMV